MEQKPSLDIQKIASRLASLAYDVERSEKEIYESHALLDHLGAVPGDTLQERIVALGQFIVAHHGQWDCMASYRGAPDPDIRPLYKCCAAGCPGYPWRASERPHPCGST